MDSSLVGGSHSLKLRLVQRTWAGQFFKNHLNLYEAYELFEDERSRRLFLYLIAFRIAGHHSVRIPLGFSLTDGSYQEYLNQEKYSDSESILDGMFGKIKHYDFAFGGRRYVADCLNLSYYLFRRQYFYQNGAIDIAPEKGDFVIDGGACLGDTAVVFANAIESKGKVYSFDPVYEHLKIVEYNSLQNPHLNIVAMPYGLADVDRLCEPIRIGCYAPAFGSGNQQVPLRSIDSLVMSGEIEKLDFVKLDVEGFELQSLNGGISSIAKFKPKLAISLYHKPNDIFEIPLFIKKNWPFYKMYIEHYSVHQGETVLYCKDGQE